MIRLRRLDLELFGQFTERSYDFGPAPRDGSDFHIIHGPNEAGKTTTMEGFLRLLYGFPHREPYAFRHERKALRVSGLLTLDGRDQELTRLPLRDGTLLDAQGQVLPEQALAAHLGGLGLEDYRSLLCLDDETIEQGGEEIASAKGDIGRLLFSAAAGIGDLTAVLDDVRARADDLYKKRGSKSRMAELKRELSEIDRQIRAEDTTASAYRALRQALHRATEDETRAAEERAAHTREHARTRARRAALPLLAEIESLDALIDSHAGMPDFLDLESETLIEMLTEQRQAEADQARLDSDLARLSAERDAIARDDEGLALARDLEAMGDLPARHTAAENDLPKRRQTLNDIHDDMRRAARDLGVADTTDPTDLIVTPACFSDLELLRDAARDSRRQVDAEDDEIEQLNDRIAEACQALERQAGDEGPRLDAVLNRHAADALATRHATATQAIAEARRQAAAALAALAPGREAPTAPLTRDQAAALAEEHARLEGELRLCRETLETLETQRAEARAQIATLEQAGGLISDSAAQALLDQRNTLWQQHRESLTPETATPFEAAMQAVDGAAATRLALARDLGQLRQLQQEDARLAARLSRTETTQAALQERLDAITAQVGAAAAQVGLAPPPAPAALVTWLDRLAEAQAAQQRLALLQAEHADTLDRAARLAEALKPHFDLADPDFDTLLDSARREAANERKAQENLAAAKAQLDGLRRDLARRTDHRATLMAATEMADAAWRDAVTQAFGDSVSADVLAASFAPLRDLREQEARRLSVARQIAGMEADQRAFTAALAAIAATPADLPAREAHESLRARSAAAQEAEARHAALVDTIESLGGERERAAQALKAIETRAGEIARAFPPEVPTATLPDLRAAADLARRVIAARARRDTLLAELCSMLDVPDLDGVRAALADTTAADLDARLIQDEADGARIETAYRDAIAARSAAQRDLSAVTGDADIAVLTERKATLELEMQEAALAHLELHFGHALAEDAIRRYRDAHRSGMMKATETAFGDLTNGAYTRLRTQPEGNAETLIALDPSGQSKRAQDMSKGTRFQLYLALRAAAYEQLAQQGTVLPFFCDDIFETFDEDRTRAACRLMARIGRTGQAIYLTHHNHVVDLAREVCGDALRVHRL
ncbi:ATP-binding protein [Oceaniglobus trochenteri]|uniref:ATP-binding protein n=1 Tax=Oceaniglobus trochenteri TaxID=2763260 RepID=UPI001CFFFDE2|nr:AAA family ATPase [Oceaniglobus trochenteri]